jgi:hypothetical protein
MFYAGAVFMADGGYGLTQVLQVMSLLVFSMSFASQMLSYSEQISQEATRPK